MPIFPGGSVRVHSGNGQSNTINLDRGLSEPIWAAGVVALLRNPEGAVMASVTVP